MAKELSPAQCVLLTIHYASEANIKALHSFTPLRLDALDPDLVLRILLTYLPESTEPSQYTTYVSEVSSRLYLDVEREDVEVDISPVKDISEEQAKRRVKKLELLDLIPPEYPPKAPNDILTCFLCHRAYRIDAETGLLNLIPLLIKPFLGRNDFLRTWYISVVLPLVRREFEYYPDDESLPTSLVNFENMEIMDTIEFLLQKATEAKGSVVPLPATSQRPPEGYIVRDIKGLVGPWAYGSTQRKRRKLNEDREPGQTNGSESESENSLSKSLPLAMRKINLDGVGPEDKTGHDWEYLYRWLIHYARENFPLVVDVIEGWDGPGDVDLGSLNPGNSELYLDDEVQRKLELQYAQAAFASCYSVQADTKETVGGAHSILARLAELLDFVPPPDLATSVESLPKMERHAILLEKSQTIADLGPETLLRPEHPLTSPKLETYMLLQMFVYSAYQFSGLGHAISLSHVAKLHLFATAEEQLLLLQKILRGLSKSGARKDDIQWANDRAKLIWLWNWGIEPDNNDAINGAGVLGRVPKEDFEESMLRCFTETSSFGIAIELYLKGSHRALSQERIQHIVLSKAMEAYDGASNGNKTRGGIKKANDIISAFRPYFPTSVQFREAAALVAATHSLSFYSLTLQHGVPFQPVNIRVSQDPIGLIDKVLEQNPGSYTKLDDLISIGKHLVSTGLPEADISGGNETSKDPELLEWKRKDVERRVTFMAVEAALREDDFETAYSYIVNRLTPNRTNDRDFNETKGNSVGSHRRIASKSSTRSRTDVEDDISWRAAFLAGRFRPAASSTPTLRRLEQRTELLSLALLLAPTTSLTEILAAWRRCEEEATAMQLSQQQAEEEFDDRADNRQSTSSLPGNFTIQGEGQPAMVLNQKRREMGRMTGRNGKVEAPISVFDLTRNAAQAFSKNAFPLRGVVHPSSSNDPSEKMEASAGSVRNEGDIWENQQRLRKRDMVANAVSGGLASGLGWVLGATPSSQQRREEPPDHD